MKLRLTLLMVEIDQSADPMSDDFARILIDGDDLPHKYASTKSIMDTLFDLYAEISKINMGWNLPILESLRKREESSDFEALYYCTIPRIDGWVKRGKLYNLSEMKLEEFYEHAIIKRPRSLRKY